MTIDKADIAATFIALPWRIASEDKARQVAQAVEAVFNTRAIAFHGGDGWYALAAKCEALATDEAAERLDILFSLMEQFDVTPSGDYYVEPLPLPHDDEDEELAAIRDIAYRGEHTINLDRRFDDLSAKLDRIAMMIGPVDLAPAVN